MKYIKYILFAGLVGTMSSCVSDLLDRQPTTEVSSDLFWKSTDDALSSTYGVYNAIRDLYATDYYYDGQGEFQNTLVVISVLTVNTYITIRLLRMQRIPTCVYL